MLIYISAFCLDWKNDMSKAVYTLIPFSKLDNYDNKNNIFCFTFLKTNTYLAVHLISQLYLHEMWWSMSACQSGEMFYQSCLPWAHNTL